MEQTTRVTLTDSELALLDGRCSDEAQTEVDAAKFRLEHVKGKDNPQLWEFIADAKRKAATKGKLRFLWTSDAGKCRICGEGGGYHPHPRSSRYHRKGDANFKTPKLTCSVELDPSCVRIVNRVALGCCERCWVEHQPTIAAELVDVKAEIPKSITGVEPKHKCYLRYKCTKCGWEGHEGEMRQLRTVMGDGTYAGGCPKCEAANHLFSSVLTIQPGNEVVAV